MEKNMNDFTLLTISWNQRNALELMLRTFVKHHYTGEPFRLVLVDNGSTDDSKEWLKEKSIPFLDLPKNVGHEQAINFVYSKIKTKYCLLLDTDIKIQDNVFDYFSFLTDNCVSVGDLIEGTAGSPIHPRISPWFWLFDIQKMKEKGINIFRGGGCTDWSYDVGSWYWERMQEFGLSNHQIERIGADPNWVNRVPGSDPGGLGQPYRKFFHFTKVSCGAPSAEINFRREFISRDILSYQDVDLADKFTGENDKWSEEFVDSQVAKGWWPL